MSRGFKIALVVLLAPPVVLYLLLFLIGSLFFYDPIDYFVAKTIPIYSQSNNVKVSASSGFPDGSPGADISFYTNDGSDQILSFYDSKLKSSGWQEKSRIDPNKDPGCHLPNNDYCYLPDNGTKILDITYTKSFLNYTFNVRITKTDIVNLQKLENYYEVSNQKLKKLYKNISKPSVNYSNYNRVIIFVNTHIE